MFQNRTDHLFIFILIRQNISNPFNAMLNFKFSKKFGAQITHVCFYFKFVVVAAKLVIN